MSESKENGLDDTPLFNPAILKDIDWDSHKASYKNGVSPTNPGESLILRPLCLGDYDRGYMQLLSQLTKIGKVSREQFKEKFEDMKACGKTYFITVLENTETNQVIGSSTLVVEHKFIHSAGKRGRIEDVVVNSEYRGKQLGKLLVEAMTLLGKSQGCYKMSLECHDSKLQFYENFGYTSDPSNNFLIQRYKD